MKIAVIFGGSGFIGSHFSQYLLENKFIDKIIVADILPLDTARTTSKYKYLVEQGFIEYMACDVRSEIKIDEIGDVSLIANFAAIHREPGHEPLEYFETNLKGAENVCDWADEVNCKNLIFTSSIAPYGPSETELTEKSIPVPVTPYGASKLVAETIHAAWQKQNMSEKKLVIVRPGVVFGAGEGGNVSRLVKATLKGYFLYMGNKNTRKAGVYVKELCNAMWWVLENQTINGKALFNMSMNPGPTISEYVDTVCHVAGVKRFVPNVPWFSLYLASHVIAPIAGLLKINQPISPVRIKKLARSNNILPKFLEEHNYLYKYTFIEAMVDWKNDKGEDWS